MKKTHQIAVNSQPPVRRLILSLGILPGTDVKSSILRKRTNPNGMGFNPLTINVKKETFRA